MQTERFAYVWQYTIRADQLSEFLAAYRPDGEWTRLFSQDPNYIKTELLRDSDRSDRYLTIDYWTSRAARDAFRENYSTEFSQLDRKCEQYTLNELFVGDFLILDRTAD